MECSLFNCESLTLVDPVPYCHQSEDMRNDLLIRAGYYDMFMENANGERPNLGLAVTSLDIRCVGDLERHVYSSVPESFARELSLMVDSSVKLVKELSTRDLSPEREKYTGVVTFFKADEPEFFERLKFDDCYHPDGTYGWSRPFPTLRRYIPLSCRHLEVTTHDEAVRKVSSTLVSLLKSAEHAIANTSHTAE